MTEKVKITQEVADAIERLRNAEYSDYGIVVHVASEGPSNHDNGDPTEGRILRNWIYDDAENADKLLDALRNGYEVEPKPLEIGQWKRYRKNYNEVSVGEITGCRIDKGWVEFDDGVRVAISNVQGDATPEEIANEKERRLWKSIGREVGEFKAGDAYKHRNYLLLSRVGEVEGTKEIYEAGKITGFFPVESFISFEEVEPNATTDN